MLTVSDYCTNTQGSHGASEPPLQVYGRESQLTMLCCLSGLMSNDGLRQLARDIGSDWRRLANALRISSSLKETSTTYEVLRQWRDFQHQQRHRDVDYIRSRLCDALTTAHRSDLAQKLHDDKMTTTRSSSASATASNKIHTVV